MKSLEKKKTTIHIDIRFLKDGQWQHLLNYVAYLEDDDIEDNAKISVSPEYLSFNVDGIIETNGEITDAVVNYLSSLKLYLHSYSVARNRTFVSYTRKEPAFSEKLTYSPAHQTLELFIEAEAQTEDGVDYEKELNIKLHHPIDSITQDEINSMQLAHSGVHIIIPAILHEDEMPKLCS